MSPLAEHLHGNLSKITTLDRDAFLVDKNIITEYERLKQMADKIPF